MGETTMTLEQFLDGWNESAEGNRAGFLRLRDRLAGFAGIEISFHPRPGLTYSLRGSVPGGARPLFVMVDVIEDEPRWLSVCFYGDLVQDPEERGSFVPGGLLGEDALCFDLERCDDGEGLAYVEARIDEAYRAAIGG
ncbi:MAG: hypothetical protein ACOX5Z_11320 [Desulfobulbus sp.]|jgi:hypothetical protein